MLSFLSFLPVGIMVQTLQWSLKAASGLENRDAYQATKQAFDSTTGADGTATRGAKPEPGRIGVTGKTDTRHHSFKALWSEI